MKEKILSSLPYLLLALFFCGIILWNINGFVEKPVSSNNVKVDSDLSVQESPNEELPQSSESEKEIVEPSDTVEECYYTKNGTKYHSTPDCRYLKNSVTIIKTYYENAKALNLTPCSACADQ